MAGGHREEPEGHVKVALVPEAVVRETVTRGLDRGVLRADDSGGQKVHPKFRRWARGVCGYCGALQGSFLCAGVCAGMRGVPPALT